MDAATALDIAKTAIMVLMKISLPLMLVALVVGLTISFFQAITQIQEMTLTFVPKIVAIFLALLLFLPYMGGELTTFSQSLSQRIIAVGGENGE